jgi:hypothetical protein
MVTVKRGDIYKFLQIRSADRGIADALGGGSSRELMTLTV